MTRVGSKYDRQRQSVYLPVETVDALEAEAKRQDRSKSYIVQQALKLAFPTIKKFPSVNERGG